MSRSSLEAFSALWRAYGEGRLDRSLDLVHPECVVLLLDRDRALHGHEGIRACLAASQRAWRTLRIVYQDVYEDHPGCVVGTGQLAASSADGSTQVERPIAVVAEFRDGVLVRARVFDEVDRALGAARDLRDGPEPA
jgi:ketosteroid isomerase-like protein